jgi:hypothetical protein
LPNARDADCSVNPYGLQRQFVRRATGDTDETILSRGAARRGQAWTDVVAVAAIAFTAGFGDVSYFYKAFRRRRWIQRSFVFLSRVPPSLRSLALRRARGCPARSLNVNKNAADFSAAANSSAPKRATFS